ncbi:MAG: PKD domain-containing protein [Thermoplasmatota archaeon]
MSPFAKSAEPLAASNRMELVAPGGLLTLKRDSASHPRSGKSGLLFSVPPDGPDFWWSRALSHKTLAGRVGHGIMSSRSSPVLALVALTLLAGCTNGPPPSSLVKVNVFPAPGDRAHSVVFQAKLNMTGAASAWLWTFGDGAAATTQNTTHRYSTLGTFFPTLNVTINGKPVPIPVPAVKIQNLPPTASAQSDVMTAHRNAPVHFTDQSTDLDGTIASWAWDFGVGDSINGVSHDKSPNYTYKSLGQFIPKLTVTDNDGAQASFLLPAITVANMPPLAAFDFSPSSPGAGQSVSFNDKSSDADGTLAAWSWDFGDGESSTVQAPSHTYSQSGAYTVHLTVRDNDGASASASQSVYVAGALVAVSNFQYTDRPCNDDVPFSFTVSNPGTVTATNVALSVTGGYQDYHNTASSVAPGQSGSISGDIYATDNCGQTDNYTITVTATPSNGPAVSRQWTISI